VLSSGVPASVMNIPPKDLESEYRTLCRALQESRTEEAVEAVKRFPEKPERLERRQPRIEPVTDGEASGVAKRARSIPVGKQLRVFRRDGFNCAYCGNKTVLVPALRVIAEYFKEMGKESSFRYHKNWKYAECHYAFWRDSASCDHIRPFVRGGGIATPTSDIGNLITACFMCNLQKGKSAGPEHFDGPARPWDGLAGIYPPLVRKRWGSAIPGHHSAWITALERPAPGSDLASQL
jgi:5-methylcytosine-specific restriction endonuclease McrA